MTMKIPSGGERMARLRPPGSVGAIAATLLAGAVIGGWAISTLSTTSAAAVGDLSAFETMRRNVIDRPLRDELKHRLIGSYVVSGTDPDGKPYAGAGIVDIALAPSGALELDWDNGKQVGVAPVDRRHAGGGLLVQGSDRHLDDDQQSGRLARRQVVAPYGSGPEGH